MRVLLDAGIFSHSAFAESWVEHRTVRFGHRTQVVGVHGLIRKAPGASADQQKQEEALFTIGRLIREGQIRAFEYNEIHFERVRIAAPIEEFNALRGCTIDQCAPALERSRFERTISLRDMFSKGGKKDRRKFGEVGAAGQIGFMEFLCTLPEEHVDELIEQHASLLGLTDFEVDSLRNIHWFQVLCGRSQSRENYPDVFHLWTAERNGLDAVLTLERGLPNLVRRVRNEKKKQIEIRTEVLRPLDLLHKLNIQKPDPVPMDAGRFYHLHEVT
jgi:hypothetical protein